MAAKNSATMPRTTVVSYQCAISISARVRPENSVVIPAHDLLVGVVRGGEVEGALAELERPAMKTKPMNRPGQAEHEQLRGARRCPRR